MKRQKAMFICEINPIRLRNYYQNRATTGFFVLISIFYGTREIFVIKMKSISMATPQDTVGTASPLHN